MQNPGVHELTDEERRFLELVAPIGLDWRVTREEFRAKHGARSLAGLGAVITLPPSTALTSSALEFSMYDEPGARNLPPDCLWAYFMTYDDSRQNHEVIENQLRTRLGQPIANDVSNCIQREWRFGVFSIILSTFPPELQPPEFTRPGSNPYLEQNPRIKTASKISLKSEYALVYPDPRLMAGVPACKTSFWKSAPASARVLASTTSHGMIARYPHRRETLRNPKALSELIQPRQLVAWSDNENNRIALSAKRDSYLFQQNPGAHLVLIRLERARGPGGYSLHFAPGQTSILYQDTVHLLDDSLIGDLPTTAKQLAEAWQMDLHHETGADD